MNPRIEYGDVQVFDDVLPPHLYRELTVGSQRIGWRFGSRNRSDPAARCWHHEVGHEDESSGEISDKVRKHPFRPFGIYQDWMRTHLVPPDTRVSSFYLTAHTYGTDGSPHVDTEREGELICMLYLTPAWKPEWCGETVVFTNDGDIGSVVLPRPNRLVAFPSCRGHVIRPLSKAFEGLRVLLVLRLASPTENGDFFRSAPSATLSPLEKGLATFLADSQARGARHTNRTLDEHLWGTYRLLKFRGSDMEVCVAGLFHSVYGTSIYGGKLPVSREAVRQRIGERAERLAWLFSALKRPQCWAVQGKLLPLAAAGQIEVSEQDRLDLVCIERANLDEQGILSPERRQGLN